MNEIYFQTTHTHAGF